MGGPLSPETGPLRSPILHLSFLTLLRCCVGSPILYSSFNRFRAARPSRVAGGLPPAMSTEQSDPPRQRYLEKSGPAQSQDAIWEYFQNEAPGSFRAAEPRLRFLMRSLRRDQTVLNIGVGSGLFEDLALGVGIQVHSLDPNQKSIERLRERLVLGDRAKVGYCQEIPSRQITLTQWSPPRSSSTFGRNP